VTPEQAAGVLGGLSALIVAVTGLIVAVRSLTAAVQHTRDRVEATHALVNSKMAQLLVTARLLGEKQGELQGRAWQLEQARDIPTDP
jgi:hypothetical protein